MILALWLHAAEMRAEELLLRTWLHRVELVAVARAKANAEDVEEAQRLENNAAMEALFPP